MNLLLCGTVLPNDVNVQSEKCVKHCLGKLESSDLGSHDGIHLSIHGIHARYNGQGNYSIE